MARVTVSIDDAQVKTAIAGLLAAGQDLTPAMDEIGSMLVASTLHRFETETGPDGQPWKPSRRAAAQGGQTLTDSARLRTSITHIAGNDQVDVGTNVIYAAIHQKGGTITAKNGGRLKFNIPGVGWRSPLSVTMPARPFLGIDEGDRAEILDILNDHLAEGANAG